jgi:hypothetical protein
MVAIEWGRFLAIRHGSFGVDGGQVVFNLLVHLDVRFGLVALRDRLVASVTALLASKPGTATRGKSDVLPGGAQEVKTSVAFSAIV